MSDDSNTVALIEVADSTSEGATTTADPPKVNHAESFFSHVNSSRFFLEFKAISV